MKVKKLSLLISLSLVFFINCSSNDDNSETQFESSATIAGLDMAQCACCGGWIININGEDADKRFSELPQNSNIDLENATFPLSVQLNWSGSNEYCGNGITIQSIELTE